jgi:hypothetical protein
MKVEFVDNYLFRFKSIELMPNRSLERVKSVV